MITLVGVGPGSTTRLRTAIAGRPVYVHVDRDVLEPGLVPTDYRVPGGLTLDDLVGPGPLLDALQPLLERAGAAATGPGPPRRGQNPLVSRGALDTKIEHPF